MTKKRGDLVDKGKNLFQGILVSRDERARNVPQLRDERSPIGEVGERREGFDTATVKKSSPFAWERRLRQRKK